MGVILRMVPILLVSLGPGCAGRPADPAPPSKLVETAVDFRGTCHWGRSAGAPEDYELRLRVLQSPVGVARVRSTPMFRSEDSSNVMGEVETGTVLAGHGPLAGSRWSGGVGYAVLVRGHDGRVCRGYVTASAVKVVEGR